MCFRQKNYFSLNDKFKLKPLAKFESIESVNVSGHSQDLIRVSLEIFDNEEKINKVYYLSQIKNSGLNENIKTISIEI